MKLAVASFALALTLAGSGVLACAASAQGLTPATYSTASQLISGTRLCGVGRTAAAHLLPDRNHVLVPLGAADQSVPAGAVRITADAVQSYGGSYVNVPLTIRVNGTVVRTVYAGFRIVNYVTRAQTARALPVGHILEASDFVTARVPETGSVPTDLKTLIGRSLVTDVEAGQPVTLWQTTIPIVVHSGDPVVLVIHDGPVALAADVVARSSGGVGQSVSVYDQNEDHTLNAVVVAPGQVEVRLPEAGT